MITLFIVSWLPYALVATFGFVGLTHLVTPYSAELPVMLAKASAIWNPIVYALKHPRYRSAVAEYLPSSIKVFVGIACRAWVCWRQLQRFAFVHSRLVFISFIRNPFSDLTLLVG